MRAHFGMPSVESDELEGKRPITVSFEIPYFTVSGIQVRPPGLNHVCVCMCVISNWIMSNGPLSWLPRYAT